MTGTQGAPSSTTSRLLAARTRPFLLLSSTNFHALEAGPESGFVTMVRHIQRLESCFQDVVLELTRRRRHECRTIDCVRRHGHVDFWKCLHLSSVCVLCCVFNRFAHGLLREDIGVITREVETVVLRLTTSILSPPRKENCPRGPNLSSNQLCVNLDPRNSPTN